VNCPVTIITGSFPVTLTLGATEKGAAARANDTQSTPWLNVQK